MAMALGVTGVGRRRRGRAYVTDDEAHCSSAERRGSLAGRDVRLHADADLSARLAANARRRVAAICDLDAFTREMFAMLDREPER